METIEIERSPADEAVRRLLRIPERPVRAGGAPDADAHRAFTTSIAVSAARCLLTYVLLPFVAPAVGIATGVGPWVGIPLAAVAIVANVVTVRRFFAAEHRWRWAYACIAVSIIGLLLVLAAADVAELVG